MLPVPMMNVLNGGAHADNTVDFQEFMVDAGRRASFSEALRWGTEVFHALKKTLHDRGLGDRGRRRGRLRARPRLERGGARGAGRGHRGRRLHARRGGRDRARPGHQRALARTARTSSSTRAARCSAEEMADYWAEHGRRATRSSRSRTAWTRRTGTAGSRSPSASASACSSSATTCSSPTPSACSAGIERGVGQLDPRQGQPDRHAHRDARGGARSRATAGYTAVMSHRSGETEDTTIADLAVATGCGQIKTGAPVALGPGGEVQPAAAHRGGARRATPPIRAARSSA